MFKWVDEWTGERKVEWEDTVDTAAGQPGLVLQA